MSKHWSRWYHKDGSKWFHCQVSVTLTASSTQVHPVHHSTSHRCLRWHFKLFNRRDNGLDLSDIRVQYSWRLRIGVWMWFWRENRRSPHQQSCNRRNWLGTDCEEENLSSLAFSFNSIWIWLRVSADLCLSFLGSNSSISITIRLDTRLDLKIGCMVKMASDGSTTPYLSWIQINPSRLNGHGGTLRMSGFWVHYERFWRFRVWRWLWQVKRWP